jgi:peptidoglycan L-alanyl-D-glutamate endopeptidase CwlK
MDKITIERIEKAHPIIREELKKLYLECNRNLPKGVRLRFTSVYRTPEEQDVLFKKRPKVTQAKRFQSIHNYGLAFDMVLLIDKDNNGTFESISYDVKSVHYMYVVSFFKFNGYEWGGDWKSFKDAPHFQKTFNNTWQSLKAKLDSGKTIEDNEIKYPKI